MQSARFRYQAGGACLTPQRRPLSNLVFRNAATTRRQPVITAADVVCLRIRTLVELFDQPIVEHPLNRSVERPRSEPQRATGPGGDGLHDGVSMSVAVAQSDEDVQYRHRNGQAGGTIS